METFTSKGVSCFIYNANKYRQYYVKKNKNVCWRCTHKACKARIETRDGTVVGDRGFHCHSEKILNASATVLRIACKRKASEHVMERLRQQAARYVAVNSLSMARTIKRSTREKSACLRKLFREYSAGLQTRLHCLQRVGYQFAPSS